jgi:triosephosphate isomerase
MAESRRPLIAGNWKMNTSLDEAVTLARAVAAGAMSAAEVVICPPFPWLLPVKEALAGSEVRLGAQNCWPKANGAFTGEVSLAMLAELVSHVIVGHSERRQVLGESDQLVAVKVAAVLQAGLTPILCAGETLQTRESGEAYTFVANQLKLALGERSAEEIARCVIAYEPIWAIGTGVAATAADAEAMCAHVRATIEEIAPGTSAGVRVLYGGSVTADNSAEILGQTNVDGALVGGASLKAESFLKIVAAASD